MKSVSMISICTNALLSIGDKPISSFDDNTDRARICGNMYYQLRDTTLRAHPWNCAKKRVILAPLTTTPAFGWRCQFQTPSDCLRLLQVGNKILGIDERLDFELEGRTILSNANNLPIRYIWGNYDESTWDSMLVEAMTLTLAAGIAYALTKSTSLMQAKQQELALFYKQAKATNGQENPPETLGDFPLLEARLSGRVFGPGR